MKRFFALFGWAVGATAAAGMIFTTSLLAQSPQEDSRRSVGRVRPVAPGTPVRPGVSAGSSASSGPVQTPTMKEWRPTVVPYGVYPYGVYPYGVYSPGYWYGDYYYPYSGYPYYLPPVHVPAETWYGPQAIKRFLGSGTTGGTASADSPAREDRSANLRGTNRESLALAGRFITFGDNNFTAQRYNEANQRYKKAAEIAPGLADAYLRQGFALTAMGRYELAVKALKRGLDIEPTWARSDFRIDSLYGDNNNMAKRAHLDALAKAATDEPANADLLFLVGVFLYFDGQTERAAPFFQRAAQLGDNQYLRGFLAQREK